MPNTQDPRSYLLVSATQPHSFDLAIASRADRVVIDLHGVPAADKRFARDRLAVWLGWTKARVIVRLNAADSEWSTADATACKLPAVLAVMLPRTASASDVARVHEASSKPVIAVIDTARGVSRLREIATSVGVERLAFGSAELARDLDLHGFDDADLDVHRAQLAIESRAAGLGLPIDAATPVLDRACIENDMRRGRRVGMGSKLCIDACQLVDVHHAFAPKTSELDWARRVLNSGIPINNRVGAPPEIADDADRARAQRLLDADARFAGLS
jgi:citrate lyase subunit beta/citryl-CoA lyase